MCLLIFASWAKFVPVSWQLGRLLRMCLGDHAFCPKFSGFYLNALWEAGSAKPAVKRGKNEKEALFNLGRGAVEFRPGK